MADEEACEKITVNMVSSSVLYMFVKKYENLRITIYKIEIVCARQRAWYYTRWAPKHILGTRFFSVTYGHISSNYELEFFGGWC